VFFCHGFGGIDTVSYAELMRHIASRGWVAVYSPYQILAETFEDRYNTLWEGFIAAQRVGSRLIDTSRVGFMGHSFGAGAVPAMTWKAVVERGWGRNGVFMFSMAPWYSFQLSNDQVRTFPSSVKLLMQLYNDDIVNDHRMAIDLFNALPIPRSEKNFVTVMADTVQTAAGRYIYGAGHSLCVTTSLGREFDAYDYYAVFRPLDALAEYTWNGSAAGKNVALGNGSAEQVFMGTVATSSGVRPVKPLLVSAAPTPQFPQSRFQWQCGNSINPRAGQCNVQTSVHFAHSPSSASSGASGCSVAPQPVSGDEAMITVVLERPSVVNLSLHTPLGTLAEQCVAEAHSTGTHTFRLNLRAMPQGVYFLRCVVSVSQSANVFSAPPTLTYTLPLCVVR
jgi:hypothetical protein